MFLEKTIKRNPALVETAIALHQEGAIQPNTYVMDVDQIEYNTQLLAEEARKQGITLYMMTKQIGRNPELAKRIAAAGIKHAVAVDPWEALVLAKAGVSLGHVGHLVQIPNGMIAEILSYRPEVITVFSLEKAKMISDEAVKQGIVQKLLIRVVGEKDRLYPGQEGGFTKSEWIDAARSIEAMAGTSLAGVTAFPCFLYEGKHVRPTENCKTVQRAVEQIQDELNIELEQVNMPSANSVETIKLIAELGGTHGEPGHALTGTTPLHAVRDLPELPAMVYVSEISHCMGEKAYTYGGGFYRRSNSKKALVVNAKDALDQVIVDADEPIAEMIDYCGTIDAENQEFHVGDTVLYAFRTQIFMTRSSVALVAGIQSGNPEVIGIYDGLGRKKD
jgi:predicted amino acid racemase